MFTSLWRGEGDPTHHRLYQKMEGGGHGLGAGQQRIGEPESGLMGNLEPPRDTCVVTGLGPLVPGKHPLLPEKKQPS